MALFDERLYDKVFDLKMSRQKILNKTLELILGFAEKQTEGTIDTIKLVEYTFKDYESEGLIILEKYKKRHNSLKEQLNSPIEYINERNSD